MHSLHPVRFATLAVILCSGLMAAQSTKPPMQPLNLPNPTPRPPDLEREYGGDPADAARQQQLAGVRAAQIHLQVVQATDKLMLIADQLKSDMSKRETGAPMTPELVKVEEIEKLAKTVKEKIKAQ